MIEEWKDVKGYEGIYQVSNLGNVKSLNYNRTGKEKVLRFSKDKDEYLTVILCKDGKLKNFKVHRLVSQAFIPNTENKPCIDHINTNRTDNRVNNLRWVTHKENSNNSISIKKMKIKASKSNLGKFGKLSHNHKPILQFSLDGEFIRKWYCAYEVQRELGFNQSGISNCCNGKYKTANGYIWGFEKDYEPIQFKVFDLKIYKKVS